MLDSPTKLSFGRSLLVAAVLWSLLLAATGFAAWLVHERAAAGRVNIAAASLRMPTGFSVLPNYQKPEFFSDGIEAVSLNGGHLVLGQFTLKDPVSVQQVLTQVGPALIQAEFRQPDGSQVDVQWWSHAMVLDPKNAGPVDTYASLLCRSSNSAMFWHMIIGLATDDEQRYVVFAMRFRIPPQLVGQPILQPIFNNNASIYRAVARTLELK